MLKPDPIHQDTDMRRTLCILWAMSLSPTLQAVTVEEAEALYDQQRWAESVEAHETLVEQQPDNAVLWFRLGVSQFLIKDHADSVVSLGKALAFEDPSVPQSVWLTLARAQAASDDPDGAMATLNRIVQSGVKPYQTVSQATEFKSMMDRPDFVALLEALKPCQSEAHRAFDFWVGQWTVTSPSRPGWSSINTIRLINDGCTLHEHYESGAYT